MNRPIIALDFSTMEHVRAFLKDFDEPLFVKVGMELYLQNGPEVIKELRSMGHDVFLDLKLHDIPNTVGKAMEGLAALDVQMTNVHAQGGVAMMKRAAESFRNYNPDGLLIAVTQLTSMSAEVVREELGSRLSLDESVVHFAKLAQSAGLDGVVCSPLEAELVHEACGKEFKTVTPGIRLQSDTQDDQVRIITPEGAKDAGCDYIVVGRSITGDPDPTEKYRKIKKEFESGEQ